MGATYSKREDGGYRSNKGRFMRKPGRRSKLDDEMIKGIARLLGRGWTRRESCAYLGIHHTTFYRWLQSSAKLADAVERAEKFGREAREYRVWERHPFRGKRPPCDPSKAPKRFPKPKFGS